MPTFKTEDLQEVFVSSIYGAKTKKGIVQLQIGKFQTQLSILEAQNLAHLLLEAAQGASVDQVLVEFFRKVGLPDEMLATVLKDIRDTHNRNDARLFET